MNRKLKGFVEQYKGILLFLLVILSVVFIFYLIFIANLQHHEKDSIDNADFIVQQTGEMVIEQDIIATSPQIMQVAIDTGEVDTDFSAYIVYEIRRTSDGKIIYSGERGINAIENRFPLELKCTDVFGRGVKVEEGESYTLMIDIKPDTDGILSIFANTLSGQNQTLLNGQLIGGTLCYQIQYNDNTTARNLYWGLAFLLVIMLVISYYFIFYSKLNIERVFVVAAFFMGTVVSLLLPPGCVEDECSHFMTSSAYLGKIQSVFQSNIDNSYVYARQSDVPMIRVLSDYNFSQKASLDYYKAVIEHTELFVSNSELVPIDQDSYLVVNSNGNIIIYFPCIIGLFIARIIRLGTIPMLYLMRGLNFSVYILLCYIGIKKIPVGKLPMTMSALLPPTLQFAASLNYDAINFGICIAFVGYFISFIVDDVDYSKRDKIILSVLTLLLGFTKAGLYIILACLFFMLIKDFRNLKKWILLIRYGIIVVVGFALNVVILRKLFNMTYPLLSSSFYSTGIVYGGSVCYSIPDLQSAPLNVIIMMLRTIVEKGGELLMVLFGKYYSWELIKIPDLYVYVIVFIVVSTFFLSTDAEHHCLKFTRFQKSIVWMTIGLTFFAVMFMMLIAGTQKGDFMVHAIRARYFLPLISLGYFVTPHIRLNNGALIKRKLFGLFLLMVSVSVLRLFSEIMTRILQ